MIMWIAVRQYLRVIEKHIWNIIIIIRIIYVVKTCGNSIDVVLTMDRCRPAIILYTLTFNALMSDTVEH